YIRAEGGALRLTIRGYKGICAAAALSALALLIGAIVCFPVVYAVMGAFKPRAEFAVLPPELLPQSFLYIENFIHALTRAPLVRFMLNSVIVSAMGCAIRIVFAALAAYAFAYYKFPGKGILFGAVLATMMLPADTLIVTNYLTVSRMNLLDNYFGMIITSLVGATQMFMLRQCFRTIPPSLRDAAFIDGCGDLRYLTRIALPVARPVVLTLMVQSFCTFWNMYLWPLLITNRTAMRTVQVGITMLTNPLDPNHGLVMAAVSIILIPSFVLFIFLRRSIARGVSLGSLV
ncbi:MAG: carbohydrate ABC transporter permease, partial [Oscillospiraceae bacterium]|nr:carbohydrate ABC transporter permease [Oscillospiraceae bacterium]